jgi:D-sedoheptulose 7-phosphate isomerase
LTPQTTDFLYPFIDGKPEDASKLLADLASSASSKTQESRRLRARTLEAFSEELDRIAELIVGRVRRGGRIFTMGNGGSSTDADALADLFEGPPTGRPLAARSLVSDEAVITALANDVGFELVFARQLIAFAKGEDVVVGFSTSGDSENLIRGFSEAKRLGMLTVGLAGYEGGQMAASKDIYHCLVVRSESIHRIQETHAAIGLWLFERVQALLGDEEQ